MKISWLKLDVDILSDEKIKIIRKNPLGDQIFVLWVSLLCLAMKSENKGFIDIASGISATPDDISNLTDLPIEVVKIGIKTFSRLKMIEISENGMEIINFRKHQSIESLEYQRERNRIKQANHRAKLKNDLALLEDENPVSNRLVSSSKKKNIEGELELELELEKDKDTQDKTSAKSAEVSQFVDDFYGIVNPQFPKITKLNSTRIKKVAKRMGEGLRAIEIAQAVNEQPFLFGASKNGWSANFDWLVENETNWLKVIERRYIQSENKVSYGNPSPLEQLAQFKKSRGLA